MKAMKEHEGHEEDHEIFDLENKTFMTVMLFMSFMCAFGRSNAATR
jgi:hypothetical protein